MNDKSILGSFRRDLFFFYTMPVLIAVALTVIQPNWDNAIITFLIFLFIDMGHAYATLFRTYFRKQEFKRDNIYLYLPIVIFSFIFLWAYLGIPYLWSFLLYFTFFHHIRQYYGIFMWYSQKEKNKYPNEKYHLYLLTVIPFILFHFRNVTHQGLYHHDELFLVGDTVLTQSLITIYLCYLLLQCYRWFINTKMGNGVKISLIYPSVIHAFCFLYFTDSFNAFIPLLVMHGISYVVIVIYSTKKLSLERSTAQISFLILSVILICVLVESSILESYDVFVDPLQLKSNTILSAVASLAVLPNLLHYILDSIIWKKNNPDFKKIID